MVFSTTRLPTTFGNDTDDRRESSHGRTTSPRRAGARLIAMYGNGGHDPQPTERHPFERAELELPAPGAKDHDQQAEHDRQQQPAGVDPPHVRHDLVDRYRPEREVKEGRADDQAERDRVSLAGLHGVRGVVACSLTRSMRRPFRVDRPARRSSLAQKCTHSKSLSICCAKPESRVFLVDVQDSKDKTVSTLHKARRRRAGDRASAARKGATVLDRMRKLRHCGSRGWVVASMVATFSVAMLAASTTMADPKAAPAATDLRGCCVCRGTEGGSLNTVRSCSDGTSVTTA
jgi:hypothetical protein